MWHDVGMIALGMVLGALCATAGITLAELKKMRNR
jgi:hypothetical protein